MCNHLLNPRKYWVLERGRRPKLTRDVTLVSDVGGLRIWKSLKRWRPRRDLNPRLRRERAIPVRLYNYLEGAGGTVRTSKTPAGTAGAAYRYMIVTQTMQKGLIIMMPCHPAAGHRRVKLMAKRLAHRTGRRKRSHQVGQVGEARSSSSSTAVLRLTLSESDRRPAAPGAHRAERHRPISLVCRG
jgi:hypothetical protein